MNDRNKEDDKPNKRDRGATNSPERRGSGSSTNQRGDAGELPLDPDDQTESWKEKEDSSLDSNPEEDRKKGAKWAKKDAHPGKISGKSDESGEEKKGWNAKDFGEGSGHRQPNALDDQLSKAEKDKKQNRKD